MAVNYGASPDKAAEVVRELEGLDVRAAAFKADQADPSQVESLIKAVVDQFGRLDILVNNAGVFARAMVGDPESGPEAIKHQYAVNLGGVLTAIRAAAKVMRDGGRIVTIGSGVANRVGLPGLADYAATKAAVAGFSKGVVWDLAPRNITVNVVQPGPISTDMNPPTAAISRPGSRQLWPWAVMDSPRRSQPASFSWPAPRRPISREQRSTSMAGTELD